MADAARVWLVRVGVEADAAERDDLLVVFDREEFFARLVEEEVAGFPAVCEPADEAVTLFFGFGDDCVKGRIVWSEGLGCHR